MRVAVAGVDVAGAGAVRGARDRARERCVLDARADLDELARLHVRADVDDELGVAVEPVAATGGHSGSCQTSSRRIGTRVAVGGEPVDLELGRRRP